MPSKTLPRFYDTNNYNSGVFCTNFYDTTDDKLTATRKYRRYIRLNQIEYFMKF